MAPPASPISSFFLYDHAAPTEFYTLSLHDALPIFAAAGGHRVPGRPGRPAGPRRGLRRWRLLGPVHARSEEHTSELQSRFDLVCRLLLEKKKNTRYKNQHAPSTSQSCDLSCTQRYS